MKFVAPQTMSAASAPNIMCGRTCQCLVDIQTAALKNYSDEKEMLSSDPLGLALVAPDKAKHFYSHGSRLVRLTYFTQMGSPA